MNFFFRTSHWCFEFLPFEGTRTLVHNKTFSSSCISYLSEWRQLVTGYPSPAVNLNSSFSHVPSPTSRWPLSWMASIVLLPVESHSLPMPRSKRSLLLAWFSVMALSVTAGPLFLPYCKSVGHMLPEWSLWNAWLKSLMCFRKKKTHKLLSFSQRPCFFILTLHYIHILPTCLSFLKYIILLYNSVLTCFCPFLHLPKSHSSFTTQLTWWFWSTPVYPVGEGGIPHPKDSGGQTNNTQHWSNEIGNSY